MMNAIVRRGPDDAGAWLDNDCGVALGHRRLSIVDLSPMGHQPMLSASGRYVLVFNGEIYNHNELRAELGDRQRWRGSSDTETLLAAIEAWGLSDALRRCAGMFAFALWDRLDRELTLARDRSGEKPLYYGLAAGRFVFASDLASIVALNGGMPEIDWTSARTYFLHNSVPAPASIYKDLFKLSPGCLIVVRPDDAKAVSPMQQQAWWSALAVANGPRFLGDKQEAADELERLLVRAIGFQMLADVPVGAFLSGGIDSSLVCAMMQQASTQPIRTFSIGFERKEFNEAPHAKAVAEHLGTSHIDLIVTSAMAADLAPSLGAMWSEPFADSSQIPTAILARLAAQHVTVALTGDGGDELFCGYARYQTALELETLPARRALALGLSLLPASAMAALIRAIPLRSAKRARAENIGRIREILSAPTPMSRYARQLYQPAWHASLLRGGLTGVAGVQDFGVPHGDLLNAYGLADALEYLPSDILTKVDRAGMAVSLETRIPLLDAGIVEFALSLPSDIKRADAGFKFPLRALLYRHVPREMVDRPKMGFGIPLGEWLRHELKDWAASHIAAVDELFEPAAVEKLWAQHQRETHDWSAPLWRIIMFRAWREAQQDARVFGDGQSLVKRQSIVAQ